MYNIWGFFLQTISVSIVAGIILLLKYLFADKLSPRWQYSVWILLGIRILVPVNLKRYIIPVFSVWMEILKGMFEECLHSTYSAVYEPIQLHHVLPIVTQIPQSITDWLFVIYTAGILVCVLRYLISYIHLRILLKSGLPVGNDLEAKMLYVCEKYDLKPCRMIAVEGFSSAFICGVIHPVLVVPYAKDVDEKILLHELLHLKHRDTIQNVFWCAMRSLHWCNPLIHLVVNQIENDMESLCDQRVLERLEGEERRAYGTILLDMASKKYARIPGTSSISNGGKNISQRITAIVRFKKYPQGMKLVSVCIILVLFWPMIIGSEYTFAQSDYENYDNRFEREMAIARMNRCGTVAGALDTYTKGLYLMNGCYIASASSFSEHERIQSELEEYGCYQSGEYIVNIDYLNDYCVYNVDQVDEKKYIATICYDVSMYIDETTPELLEKMEEGEEEYSWDTYIFVSVVVTYEDAWVVEECGERYVILAEEYEEEHAYENWWMLCGKEYYGKNDVGEVFLEVETKYTVNNALQDQNLEWFTDLDYISFDTSPKPNAVFDHYELNKYIVYTHTSEERPRSYVELTVKEMETEDYFKNNEAEFFMQDHSEEGWRIFESITDDWDGKVKDTAGGGYGQYKIDIMDITDLPSAYSVELNIGGVEMQDMILEEVAD